MSRRKKPKYQKEIARERIEILFHQAEKRFSSRPELSHRYVELARKIAMRYNIKIPKELKRMFCSNCYRYLKPGVNSRVRTRAQQEAVTVKCLECGNIMRYPYRKEKKENRKKPTNSQNINKSIRLL